MPRNLNRLLLSAAQKGNVKKISALIAEGADVKSFDRGDGYTPLFNALVEGHREAWRHLLSAGADVNAKSRDSRTAMHFAALAADVEALETFVNHGLQVNAKDWQGKTPLMLATSVEAVEWLLQHGADPNATDTDGCTAMHDVCVMMLSAEDGEADEEGEKFLAMLQKHGADPTIKDKMGRTPRDFLKQR